MLRALTITRLINRGAQSLLTSTVLGFAFSGSAAEAWRYDPPGAEAQTTRWIACSLPLPPHTMQGSDGSAQGYASAVLLGVARHLGWPLEFRYMPWLRLVQEAQDGRCDLVYTVLKRTDYERFLLFPSTPIQQRTNVLLVRRDSPVNFDGDLERFMRTHSVGLYHDKAVHENFERWRRASWARVDQSTDARQNLEKLLAGRFDAAIENDITAIYQLRMLGRQHEVRVLAPAINQTPAYIALPKAGRLTSHLMDLDQALSAYQRTAEYQDIHRRFVGLTQ